jgi:hypothetical protein
LRPTFIKLRHYSRSYSLLCYNSMSPSDDYYNLCFLRIGRKNVIQMISINIQKPKISSYFRETLWLLHSYSLVGADSHRPRLRSSQPIISYILAKENNILSKNMS